MITGILTERSLDMLNRAIELKNDFDFCGETGGLPKEMRHFMVWLGDHLRSELQREAWEEPQVDMDEYTVSLTLSSPTWQLPDDDYVAFSFVWPHLFDEPPYVGLYLPAEEVFPKRNELLTQLRPKLRRNGFTDHYEPSDPVPYCPLWKYVRLEDFHRDSGFDLDSFVAAIVDAFRHLTEVEHLIEDAFQALPEKPLPLPAERNLKTIAFLDTEWAGAGTASRMTQLGIVNVAYDSESDAVVGILYEYFMDAGQTLDEPEALRALERADFVVAHNTSADKPLLARHLPGTEKKKWLCSLQGIDWRELLGVQSRSLETLMGKAGLRYEQDHTARADARDLKRLLSVKHKGRTYLGRLLDSAEGKA